MSLTLYAHPFSSYCQKVLMAHRIGPDYPALRAYRARLLARPSFARAVEHARPYRDYFPLGAPDRD